MERLSFDYVDKEGKALLDGGGTRVLGGHDDIPSLGGQSLFRDDDGTIWMAYRMLSPISSVSVELIFYP